jgi:hypothetical protein
LAKTSAARSYLTEGEANVLHSIWKHQEENGGRGATGEQIAAHLLATDVKVTLTPTTAGPEVEAYRKWLKRKLSLVRKYISDLGAKGDYIATLGWESDACGKRSKLYGLQEMVMIRRPCTARTALALTDYCKQKRESHVSIREFRQHLENPPSESRSDSPMLAKQVKEDIA